MTRRIFYDTEFLEFGPSRPISKISLAAVDEKDNYLYVIHQDLDLQQLARHPWHKENTVPYLPVKWQPWGILAWDKEHPDYSRVMSVPKARKAILDFCMGEFSEELGDRPHTIETGLELWAYYSAYDHVVLAQWFGSMIDLPRGMPMFTNDIMCYATMLNVHTFELPFCEEGECLEHYAPHDAMHVRRMFHSLKEIQDEREGPGNISTPA